MKPTGTIHFARYEASPRLQRLLAYMLHGCPRTGMEIIHGAQITAVAAAADELRENGFEMKCIKRLNPPTYQLMNIERARELSARLLCGKEAA